MDGRLCCNLGNGHIAKRHIGSVEWTSSPFPMIPTWNGTCNSLLLLLCLICQLVLIQMSHTSQRHDNTPAKCLIWLSWVFISSVSKSAQFLSRPHWHFWILLKNAMKWEAKHFLGFVINGLVVSRFTLCLQSWGFDSRFWPCMEFACSLCIVGFFCFPPSVWKYADLYADHMCTVWLCFVLGWHPVQGVAHLVSKVLWNRLQSSLTLCRISGTENGWFCNKMCSYSTD